jgi:hypothetical protein
MSYLTVATSGPVPKLETESVVALQAAADNLSIQSPAPMQPLGIIGTLEALDEKNAAQQKSVFVTSLPQTIKEPNGWVPLTYVASSTNEPMSGAKKLRKMLFGTSELIVCPGVYDGLSARTAIELGFNAMYMVRISLA